MRCPKCNSLFNDNEKYCYNCDSKMDESLTAETEKKEEPKKTTQKLDIVSMKSSLLVCASYTFMIVLSIYTIFVSFGDFKLLIGEETRREVINDVVEAAGSITPEYLICDNDTSTSNSKITIKYVEDKVVTYDVNYNFKTLNKSTNEMIEVLKEFNDVKKVITTYMDEEGFDYVIKDKYLDDTTRLLGLTYNITVDSVKNNNVLSLIKDYGLIKEEKASKLELAGYVCN